MQNMEATIKKEEYFLSDLLAQFYDDGYSIH